MAVRNSILTCLFTASLSSYAQSKLDKNYLGRRESDLKFEVLVGPSFQIPTFYYQPQNQERKTKLGYELGFGLVRPIHKRVELNARILLDKKRFENRILNPNDHNYGVTGYLKNDYLTVTLASQYLFGKQRQFAVGISGYFSSMQKSVTTIIVSDPDSTATVFSTYSTYNLYKKYDDGLIATLGFIIMVRKKYSGTIQLLGIKGLRKINNYSYPDVLPIQKNKSLSVILTLQF